MTLQDYLDKENITKYNLSKTSGIPKTTIIDICSGKSSLQKCSALTIQKLANALNCSMEFIMSLEDKNNDEAGLPTNKEYLEYDLPEYLKDSIKQMIDSWELFDKDQKDMNWDLNWCELNADINSAEVEQEISSEAAWYLREKYLRMKKGI